MVATMVILICNNAATVPTSMFGFFLGGPATMVAGIETFNRARILELRQFSWKRLTKLALLVQVGDLLCNGAEERH